MKKHGIFTTMVCTLVVSCMSTSAFAVTDTADHFSNVLSQTGSDLITNMANTALHSPLLISQLNRTTMIVDDATKEAYYAEYIKIAKEVSKDTGTEISVRPINKLSDTDWITPEAFRHLITEIANWDMHCTNAKDEQLLPTNCMIKTSTIHIDGKNYTVSISGTFATQLNDWTSRQEISGTPSISSNFSPDGTWTQIGDTYIIQEAGRVCEVIVSGTLDIGAATFHNKLVSTEFYCSAQGGIF